MPFSPRIKEIALVNSARRCAVCRKYNGVGVEVHHIVHESDGGPNELENAIVLCFDCHMAAGHYNAQHPRGTKFKPSELVRLRDDWIQRVSSSGIESLEQEFSEYYTRHLVSADRGAAGDCLALNRNEIPFVVNALHQNPVTRFMNWVLGDIQYPDGSAPATLVDSEDELLELLSNDDHANSEVDGLSYQQQPGAYFETESEFFAANPDMANQLERPIAIGDLRDQNLNSVFLQRAAEEAEDISELGKVIGHYNPCGGGDWEKYYVARKQLFVFAEIRNTSNAPITIHALSLLESGDLDLLSLRNLNCDAPSQVRQEIPPIRLEPSDNILIPEMVLLAPDSGIGVEMVSEYKTTDTSDGKAQLLGHVMGGSDHGDYLIAGPRKSVVAAEISEGENQYSISVHNFDPSNTHLFYRFWEMGCCPHLFFKHEQGGWRYVREILTDGFERVVSDRVIIPDDVKSIVIAELEFETTVVNSILADLDEILEGPKTLERGEILELNVPSGAELTISGRYTSSIKNLHGYHELWLKNALIKDQLSILATLSPTVHPY